MRQYGSDRIINTRQIALLGRSPYSGYAFRQQSPGFDPRSGEGAKQAGGRFNPPASFATLYVTPTVTTAEAELLRQGEQHAIGVQALLPRDLYMYSIGLKEVIDFTIAESRDALSIDKSDLIDSDRTLTQFIGETIFSLGVQAIISYSAACDGLIVAIFLENLHGCDIEPELVDRWVDIDQLRMQPEH